MATISKLFSLRYHPRNSIPPVASRYLAGPANSIYPKIADMYATRDRNTLWWRVSGQTMMAYKRVVRTRYMRKMRIAFKVALKQHGFDREGRRIAPATQPPADLGWDNNEYLTGSVEITISPRILDEDMSNLQSDMDQAVQRLLDRVQEKELKRQAWDKRTAWEKRLAREKRPTGKKSKWVDITASTEK